MKKSSIPWIVIPSIVLIDQLTKVLVKTSMTLGQSIPVFGDWFIIHFTENYGMAFGLEFSGEYGKLALSIFRIVAVIFIGWYLSRLIKRPVKKGLVFAISLIMAGAIGNIIDSSFYGLLFSASYFNQVATFLPEGGGYGTFLHGKVVDMLYFPIIQGRFPDWFPYLGGGTFVFFRPVFNIADSTITIGVFTLLVFQKRFFPKKHGAAKTSEPGETYENAETEVTLEQEDEDGEGFLFEQIIFGPIKSRRLGISLGVNLLPLNRKHCTFNCLYCECGWTKPENEACTVYPTREEISEALEKKLEAMKVRMAMLDTITFAGNGEPTLHQDFAGIIDDTITLRNRHYPSARIAVLSNGSMAGQAAVAEALKKVEQNILKLDAGTDETFQKINNPRIRVSLHEILDNLEKFEGNLIIQTLFVRGSWKGVEFDNTTDTEVNAWLRHIKRLKPSLVMIYPIARATPAEGVEKVTMEELEEIAEKVETIGIETEIYP